MIYHLDRDHLYLVAQSQDALTGQPCNETQWIVTPRTALFSPRKNIPLSIACRPAGYPQTPPGDSG